MVSKHIHNSTHVADRDINDISLILGPYAMTANANILCYASKRWMSNLKFRKFTQSKS